MRANIKELIKSLESCAKNHNVRFYDWYEENAQVALQTDSNSALEDVRLITKAFGEFEVSQEWNHIIIYLDCYRLNEKVNTALLKMAL